jgi:hypothetical protein
MKGGPGLKEGVYRSDLLLLVAAVIWGSAFVAQRHAPPNPCRYHSKPGGRVCCPGGMAGAGRDAFPQGLDRLCVDVFGDAERPVVVVNPYRYPRFF